MTGAATRFTGATKKGEDVVVVRKEFVTEVNKETGEKTLREIEVKELLVDDELPEVAEAYLHWQTRHGNDTL
jgi:type I restriction enzyme M protein